MGRANPNHVCHSREAHFTAMYRTYKEQHPPRNPPGPSVLAEDATFSSAVAVTDGKVALSGTTRRGQMRAPAPSRHGLALRHPGDACRHLEGIAGGD